MKKPHSPRLVFRDERHTVGSGAYSGVQAESIFQGPESKGRKSLPRNTCKAQV